MLFLASPTIFLLTDRSFNVLFIMFILNKTRLSGLPSAFCRLTLLLTTVLYAQAQDERPQELTVGQRVEVNDGVRRVYIN